ncbi:MAG TPA: 50S ribosomal protein L29 [Candidatus Woesearchaeota archaeon]|nr:50S ribosomal protein L29 [Candidatus Woesearchaeota archaeon]
MALKIKEIESMNVEEMKTKLDELKKELIKHNAQIATGTNPKSPGQVRVIKKTIARILTVLKIKGGEKKQ